MVEPITPGEAENPAYRLCRRAFGPFGQDAAGARIAPGLSVEAEGVGSAVTGRVEWSEPFVEREADDGVLACPFGLLDSVELGVEEEEKVFVLEGKVAEVAPRPLVVFEFAEVEQHLRLADEREQRKFLGDTGEREIAGLGELPADHGDGGCPVAGEAAVVVLLVAGR